MTMEVSMAIALVAIGEAFTAPLNSTRCLRGQPERDPCDGTGNPRASTVMGKGAP